MFYKSSSNITIVKNTGEYVKRILSIFGLELEKKNVSDISCILDEICIFRDKIRDFAFKNKQYDLLKLTDEVRDDLMPKLGISIEDKGKTTSLWKIN